MLLTHYTMSPKSKYRRIYVIDSSTDDEINSNEGLQTITKRNRFPCPVCDKVVVHLPRHMRTVHKVSDAKSRHINLLCNQRFKPKKRNRHSKFKDYHKRTPCPIKGCFAIVKRLPRHLHSYHKLSPEQQLISFGSRGTANSVQEEATSSDSDIQEANQPRIVTLRTDNRVRHEVIESEEEDFREPSVSQNSVDQRTTISPPKPFKKLLQDFGKFLGSPLGQQLDISTIEQHIAQLKSIMQYSKIVNNNYRELFSPTVINEAFIQLRKHKTLGGKGLLNTTIRGYISSMKHLVKFLKINPTYDPSMTFQEMDTLIQSLDAMSKGLKKKCQKESWSRMQRDVDRIPSTKDLNTFIGSSFRKSMISKLKTCNSNTTFSHNEAVSINGLLFIELSLDNANRNGEIRHITMKDFNKGTLDSDGALTIKITTHKTYYKHGPAVLVMRAPVLNLVMSYLRFIRPLLMKNASQYVFLKSNGRKLSSYSMRRYMQSAWRNCGLQSQVGPTLMRKVTVTSIHLRYPDYKKTLALKMNHSEATASRYYFTHNKESSSKQLSKNLRSMLLNNDMDTADHTPDTQQPTEDGTMPSTSGISNSHHSETAIHNASPSEEEVATSQHNNDSGSIDDTNNTAPIDGIELANSGHNNNDDAPGDDTELTISGRNDRDINGDDTDPSASDNYIRNEENDTGSIISTSTTYPTSEVPSSGSWRSMKNHFTLEEEEHLTSTFKDNILRPGRVMKYEFITDKLRKTPIGRSLLHRYNFAKLKNKLNFLKYRKCAK